MIIKKQRAAGMVEPDHAEKEAEIADAGGDEGFFCRRRRFRPVKPKTNEQVRGEADEFPADKKQQQAVGDKQAEHRRRKQTHEAEETGEILILPHVAEAED